MLQARAIASRSNEIFSEFKKKEIKSDLTIQKRLVGFMLTAKCFVTLYEKLRLTFDP